MIVMCSILFLVRGGLTTKKVRVLDDTEFGDYIGHTMFSQYLQRSDTPDGETRYYLNLEEVRDLETWNGMFCSATETVFKKSQSGFLIPLSITMENGCTFTPQSAPSKWNLAKLFVMNGLVYVTIHGRHPTLHFPYDTVNVVTKRILPPNHPVSKLLYPHFRFSMVLNVNVLTESTSASFYHWWKPYYAVTCSEEEIFGKIMRRGYEKWSFRKFPKLNPEFPYDYSLLSYYQCIRRFVTNLMPFIPADDFIFRWGDEIAKLIPGFPNGSKLVSTEGREDLIDVLTMTIFSVGVHHNTDHYSFSHLDHRILPMRIRLPPPTYDSENDHFNEEDCMSRMDYFKQAHFQNLAVWPAPSAFPILTKDTRFMNVDYKFINPQMKEMQAAFKKDLRDTAAKLKSYFGEILPLSDIVSSTEF
ncbi:lipoxygenase [Paraphysoderma sedebokerense]|nr:lipoxygenase [Paraphysoderma sedebokerense]